MTEVPRFIEDPLREAVDLVHRQIVHPRLISGIAQNDREIAHERALRLMELIQGNKGFLTSLSQFFVYRDPILETQFAGLHLFNPLGMAAGFDKNGKVAHFLGECLGFDIVKVGSVTLQPFKGNPRPRIFDLPLNQGLINRMGFPNEGVDQLVTRIQTLPAQRTYKLMVSVAASRESFENHTPIPDCVETYKQVVSFCDGVEINISSPNTKGLLTLQEPECFIELASAISSVRKNLKITNPLLFKFSPDLNIPTLEQDLKIAIDQGATGVTLANTTTDPEIRKNLIPEPNTRERGGISGFYLRRTALDMAHCAYKYIGETLPIQSSGGIQNARHVWEALTFGGASATEVYTAFVRKETSTPSFTFYILRDLARAMREEGMQNMDDFKDLRGKRVPFPRI